MPINNESMLEEEGLLLHGQEPLGKLLSKEELDDHFAWYENWALDDTDEIPELDDEDFRAICVIFEDLFEHIRFQNNQIQDVVEYSMKELSMLKKDINGLRKRKMKAAGCIKDEKLQRTKMKRV